MMMCKLYFTIWHNDNYLLYIIRTPSGVLFLLIVLNYITVYDSLNNVEFRYTKTNQHENNFI